MSNRVLAAIERRRAQINAGVKPDGSPITGNLAATEASLANTPSDHAALQDLQVRAHLADLITLDEAMTVYMALGEIPAADGWAEDADLATKIVVTSLMAEIMQALPVLEAAPMAH